MPRALVDFQKALEATGGRPALLRDLLKLFLHETPRQLELLGTLCGNSGDWDQAKVLAHRIHGSGLLMHCADFAQSAAEVEICFENPQTEIIANCMESLKIAYDRIRPLIEIYLKEENTAR